MSRASSPALPVVPMPATAVPAGSRDRMPSTAALTALTASPPVSSVPTPMTSTSLPRQRRGRSRGPQGQGRRAHACGGVLEIAWILGTLASSAQAVQDAHRPIGVAFHWLRDLAIVVAAMAVPNPALEFALQECFVERRAGGARHLRRYCGGHADRADHPVKRRPPHGMPRAALKGGPPARVPRHAPLKVEGRAQFGCPDHVAEEVADHGLADAHQSVGQRHALLREMPEITLAEDRA